MSDTIEAPPTWLAALEVRAVGELALLEMARPLRALLPRGDGHHVIVLPGFTADDRSTRPLRRLLDDLGYRSHGWGLGENLGPTAGILRGVRRLVDRTHETGGAPISVIGWSLGGIFARELAKEVPEKVRQVITLASPFTGHPRATNAFRLYEWMSGHRIGAGDVHEPLREPPSVPTTSIWSRTDGIVSWRCSVERERRFVENIEINASHFGIGAHPLALYAIADRLAQPEGDWRPFHREGWRALAYGEG